MASEYGCHGEYGSARWQFSTVGQGEVAGVPPPWVWRGAQGAGRGARGAGRRLRISSSSSSVQSLRTSAVAAAGSGAACAVAAPRGVASAPGYPDEGDQGAAGAGKG